MNIFFHASLFGKEKYGKDYELVARLIRDLKNNVYADHILKRSYHVTDEFTQKEHQEDFRRLTREIKKADAVIVEASHPSIGTGHYMTIALNYLKPVLVLYQQNPHGVLVGDPNRLLILQKYSPRDTSDLKKKIKKFIKVAESKKLKHRFNMMIDDEMVSFLENAAKKERLSKADIVRHLILKGSKQE